jgi:hypothetical protein
MKDYYKQGGNHMESTITRIEVQPEEYKRLVNLLKFVSNGSTDIIIKNGIIRQFSDSKTLLYNINTSIEGLNLALPVVKNQLDIFKAFAPDDDEENQETPNKIVFEFDDTIFRIYADDSVIEMTLADEKRLTCEFVTDEKFNKVMTGIIGEIPLKPKDVKRIQILSKNFATEVFELGIDENGKAELRLTSASKQKKAKIKKFNIEDQSLWNTHYTGSTAIFMYDDDNAKYELVDTSIQNSKAVRLYAEDGDIQVYSVLRVMHNV